MEGWADHLIVAPILVPLAAAASMLLLDERRQKAKRTLGLAATLLLVVISILLLRDVVAADLNGGRPARTYLIGNWPCDEAGLVAHDLSSTSRTR